MRMIMTMTSEHGNEGVRIGDQIDCDEMYDKLMRDFAE